MFDLKASNKFQLKDVVLRWWLPLQPLTDSVNSPNLPEKFAGDYNLALQRHHQRKALDLRVICCLAFSILHHPQSLQDAADSIRSAMTRTSGSVEQSRSLSTRNTVEAVIGCMPSDLQKMWKIDRDGNLLDPFAHCILNLAWRLGFEHVEHIFLGSQWRLFHLNENKPVLMTVADLLGLQAPPEASASSGDKIGTASPSITSSVPLTSTSTSTSDSSSGPSRIPMSRRLAGQ